MKDFILFQSKIISNDEVLDKSSTLLSDLKSRRSIREFSNRSFPIEIIENLVRIASTAPSGANKQPWYFAIIKDNEIKRLIREESEGVERLNYDSKYTYKMKKDFEQFKTNHFKQFIEDAPYLIVVFYEKTSRLSSGINKNYYALESCSIALGFLVSAIHQAGLVSLIYTPSPMKFLNKILKLEDNLSPIAIVPVGYPKSETEVPKIEKKKFKDVCNIY